MPFILFTINVAPTTSAPVEPAETKASPSTSASIFMPTAIEQSFLPLITSVGSSHISITVSACLICKAVISSPFSCAHFFIFSSSPTRVTSTPKSFCASIEPFMTSRGALSPPKASITMFITFSLKFLNSLVKVCKTPFSYHLIFQFLISYTFRQLRQDTHITSHRLELLHSRIAYIL